MSRRSVGRGSASWAAVAALASLLVPASAIADRHTWDAGGGGGRAGRSDLWGFGLTGDWIPKGGDWPCPGLDVISNVPRHKCTLSLAGEFSYASGDHKDGTLSQYVFQIGPRIMYNRLFGHHFQPYLVGLAGVTIEQNYRDKTSFSLAGGLGADIPLVRGRHPSLVFRVQQTWTWIDNNTSDDKYGQTSFALVYRHEKREPSATKH